MDTRVKEIDRNINPTVTLLNKNGSSFEVTAIFCNWDRKKEYPGKILVELKNIANGEYYHLSKCKYCKSSKEFEIHVEKVKINSTPQDHKLEYNLAKKEGFDFKQLSPKHAHLVNVYTYHKQQPETYYLICGKQSKEKLTHAPKTKATKALNGLQPETSKGNIIVANP